MTEERLKSAKYIGVPLLRLRPAGKESSHIREASRRAELPGGKLRRAFNAPRSPTELDTAIQTREQDEAISSRRLRWFFAPWLAFLFTATSVAQTSRVSATLEGAVSDRSGAAIAHAEIRVRNIETGQTRAVKADDQGFFRASELPAGSYEVRADHPGFTLYRHAGVVLALGQTVRLDIELLPGAASTQVTVTAQPPAIDRSQTAVTTTIENAKIEELPVRSRNYLNFVLLAPGVASSNPQQTSGAQTPLVGNGFTFGGLRARSNNISIDGVDNNDEYSGSSRTELSLEMIREFQVVNNGLSAESGGASGGSINVVTKSGANAVHGDAFAFAQTGALNARESVTTETRKPDLGRYRAGFSRGGPIVKDRTFYYIAFEQEHTRTQAGTDIDPPAASSVNAFLSAGASPRLATRRVTQGLFPTARAETEASGKVNHQISDRHSLMLRYAFTNDREASDAFNTGGLTDPSARGSSFTEDHALVGSWVSIPGPTTVNDLRFQWAKRRVALRTNDQHGPEINIAGVVAFGRPYEGNARRTETHDQLGDMLALARGHYLIKMGGSINRVRLSAFEPSGFGGVYIFPDVAAFFSGRPDSFRQAFGDAGTQFTVVPLGAFLQDHWSPRRRVTIDLGIRYDFERLPFPLNQDTNNVSPRVGLAYNPSSDWVMRFGFGLYYDRFPLAFLNRALEKNGSQAFEQVADGDAAAAIFQKAQSGPLQEPVAGIRPSIFRADPRLAASYSEQGSFGIERLLTANMTVSANYLLVRGLKLSRTRNTALTPPAVLTLRNAKTLGLPNPTAQQFGRAIFGPERVNSSFDDVYYLEDSASSVYHGLSIALNRRSSKELAFSAGYTFSKTIDDASDFDEQPENPFDLRSERALSRNHQGQRFVLSALFDLPFAPGGEGNESAAPPNNKPSGLIQKVLGNIELAPIVTVASGRPVNPLTGLDSNRADAFPLASRPLGFSRNALRTPGFASIDLRALKYLKLGDHRKLEFVVEAFNLLNRVNISGLNPFFGSGQLPVIGFGHPIDAFSARQIQFSVDFEY